MAEGWEAWLAGRFPGFVLRHADGASRPRAAVDGALRRLLGTEGATPRLAALGFLLDPAHGVLELVEELLPRWVARALPRTERIAEERRGVGRGRIDWAHTIELRLRTRDPSWLATSRPRRTYETPELLAIRWLLDRIGAAAGDVGLEAAETGWTSRLPRIDAAVRRLLASAALRDLPVARPEPWARTLCAQSRDEEVRAVARVLGAYDALLPVPEHEALARTVERFALVPLDAERRFELFVLLGVIEALDVALAGMPRRDFLIEHGREETVVWGGAEARVEVFYDLAAEPGRHAEVMGHYFGQDSLVRPDVRVVAVSGGQRRALYFDAKLSEASSYLAESHLKMLGYVADAGGAACAKVALVTPVEPRAAPRAGDDVVFLGPGQVTGRGPLVELVRAWLGPAFAAKVSLAAG